MVSELLWEGLISLTPKLQLLIIITWVNNEAYPQGILDLVEKVKQLHTLA